MRIFHIIPTLHHLARLRGQRMTTLVAKAIAQYVARQDLAPIAGRIAASAPSPDPAQQTKFVRHVGGAANFVVLPLFARTFTGKIIRKFSYDLWGDVVNTAARMESHGLPDHVQVTRAVFERLRERHAFEERSEIAVKGMGMMPTYFLTGRRTQDEQVQSGGTTPSTQVAGVAGTRRVTRCAIGDYIECRWCAGVVEAIGWRTTVLRVEDGGRAFVPHVLLLVGVLVNRGAHPAPRPAAQPGGREPPLPRSNHRHEAAQGHHRPPHD
jgi:hypothetical protein